MKDDVKCPYCGTDQEICHDDNYGYDENELHQQVCPECGKTFVFETSIIIAHEAFPAPCIDGDEEHKWEETNTFPKCYRRLRCSVCGEEKQIEGIEVERKAYIDELGKKRSKADG